MVAILTSIVLMVVGIPGFPFQTRWKTRVQPLFICCSFVQGESWMAQPQISGKPRIWRIHMVAQMSWVFNVEKPMDSNPNSPYYSHKNHLKYGNGYGKPLCSRFLDCSNKHSFIFWSSGMFAATNCQATRSFLCFFFQWSMIFGMQTHQQNQRVSWTKKEVFLPKQKWQRADVKRWRTPGQNLKNLKHFKDGFFHEQNWCHLNCHVVSPTGQTWISEAIQLLFSLRVPG